MLCNCAIGCDCFDIKMICMYVILNMPNILGEEKQSIRAGETVHSVEKSPDACCLSGEGERAEGDGECRTFEDMR